MPFLGGKGLGDAYQLMMSMGDSAVAVLGGGGAANMIFFGSAAASATREALSRGIDPNKAIAFGFASGLAEVAGETFSVENLLDINADDFIREGLWRTIRKQGLIEGSEEFVTTLINTFADALINGDRSELNEKIRQYGVGQYFAGWEKIQAEWFMKIDRPYIRKIELFKNGKHDSFAISQEAGTHSAFYPHVYGMQENMEMTLFMKGEAGSDIAILIDGKDAGSFQLPMTLNDLEMVPVSLRNDPGEHEIILRMTGRMTIDWFRFNL